MIQQLQSPYQSSMEKSGVQKQWVFNKPKQKFFKVPASKYIPPGEHILNSEQYIAQKERRQYVPQPKERSRGMTDGARRVQLQNIEEQGKMQLVRVLQTTSMSSKSYTENVRRDSFSYGSEKKGQGAKQILPKGDVETFYLREGAGFFLSHLKAVSMISGRSPSVSIVAQDQDLTNVRAITFADHLSWLGFAYRLLPQIMRAVISNQSFEGQSNLVMAVYNASRRYLTLTDARNSVWLGMREIEILNINRDLISYNMGIDEDRITAMKQIRTMTGSNSGVQLFQQLNLSKGKSDMDSLQVGGSNVKADWFVSIDGQSVPYDSLSNYLSKSGRGSDQARMVQHELEQDFKAQRNMQLNNDDVFFQALGARGVVGNPFVQLSDQLKKEISGKLNKPIEQMDVPTTLQAELRKYQIEGFRWITSNLQKGFGVLLSDDMGLGKTIQVITSITYMHAQKMINGPALVIAPVSVVPQWASECERFAPHLRVTQVLSTRSIRNMVNNFDIIIMTYGIARSSVQDLAKYRVEMVIIDEASKIKNPLSKIAEAMRYLAERSRYRIAITGTPVENKLEDLYSLFQFTNPNVFGSVERFNEMYVQPIMQNYNGNARNIALQKLQLVSKPFMLRRLKSDPQVNLQLPDKIIRDVSCYLAPKQVKEYRKQISGMVDRSNAFQHIMNLKKICNHLRHFNEGYGTGEPSGKLQVLLKILESVFRRKNSGNKVLIFSQFVGMIDVLEEVFDTIGYRYQSFTGNMTGQQRALTQKRFNEDPNEQILIISLKAGGLGLNLTGANYVVHYDLWWNPAVEMQATDRAHRIGQQRKVESLISISRKCKDQALKVIIDLIKKLQSCYQDCSLDLENSTLEERIDAMFKTKVELSQDTIATGTQFLSKMSTKEIQDLLKLTSDSKQQDEDMEDFEF